MKRIAVLILTVSVIFSCKKATDDPKWEGSFGQGNALFVKSSPDSGIIACGILGNKPYLIKLSIRKAMETDYKSETDGLFSAVWSDALYFIAAGSSGGKMLLARIDNEGSEVWDTVITAGFEVGLTDISYTGNGALLAVGTGNADLPPSGDAGLLFVRFDTDGHVIENKQVAETGFISGKRISVDGQGNIFLALTKQAVGGKTRATVAKYNSDFVKLWETELSNNPDFAAAAYGITVDGTGNAYVTGKTEVSRDSKILDNSFLASLDPSGSVRWKKYFENANAGSDLILNDNVLLMLNRDCFVINMADADDGTDAGRILMFDVCDPYDTDAIGSGLDLHFDGNILVAGQKGDNFYLAMKPVGP